MSDRVYPSAKPQATNGTATANGGATTFPVNKAQLYNTGRPAYRPRPPVKHRRSGRSCCCSLCLWTTLLLLLVLLLAAIAGAAFYVIYRPHRPSFSVNSLQLSRFNLTDGGALTSAFNVSVTARNPNKRSITFTYDQTSVRILSGDVDIGDGSFPAFSHGKRNVTTLKTVISRMNAPVTDSSDLSELRSSFRRRTLPIKVELETKVKVKVGKIESKKLRIRVTCDGIRVSVPSGRAATVATTSNVKCKVDPRIKIIRWTV